jgi:hypothetical protein
VTLAALFSEIEQDAKRGNISDCRTTVSQLNYEVEKLRSESRMI